MNAILKDLEGLLQKDMSRKEFLRLVGVGVLGVVGVTGAINNLKHLSAPQAKSLASAAQPKGYGGSAYGK